MLNWKSGSIGFFLGLGGLGLFQLLLLSLDKRTPFWLMFSAGVTPVAVFSIASLEIWPKRFSEIGRQFALKLFLCLALGSAIAGAIHGLTIDYVFPAMLVAIGAWPCVLDQLAKRSKPLKQVKYQQPPSEADGSLVIKSSLAKLTWLVILVGMLLAMAMSAIPSAGGWAGTLLLGPMLILAIYIYRPSANYLRIDQKGITVVIGGHQSKSSWGDIVGFHVGDVDGDRMVGILYTEAYLNDRAGIPMESGHGWIRNVFAMRPEALCALLNEWHAKTVGGRPAKLRDQS